MSTNAVLTAAVTGIAPDGATLSFADRWALLTIYSDSADERR